MKKRTLQFTALLLVLMLAAAVFPAAAVRAENKRIGTVTSTVGLRVRDAAGTVGTNHLGWLSYGTVVTILDETTVDGVIWYQINGNTDVGNVTGWSSGEYITVREIVLDGTFEEYLQSQGFPESYWEPLTALHAIYPTWQFEAVHTGLDWNEAVAAESRPGVKLAYRTSPSHYIDWNDPYIDTGRDGYWWVQASKNIIAYYMDARNFLRDPYLFMFESQSYNPQTQTVEGVEAIIGHSFMKAENTFVVDEVTYTHAQAIMIAAEQSGVSAYHLASRMLQEQGTSGSRLSLGTVPDYEGYYNYFNIGAYPHSGKDSETNGAEYAVKAGWDNQLEAIVDGAKFLGNSYINAGQDTVYFQNFNVVSANAPYTHQYMTNVQAGETEAQILRGAYNEASVQNAIVFRIPVYENMPAEPTPQFAPKWVQNEVGWWYDYGNGSWPASKWEFIDGNWYYFNEGGYRVSGWHHIGHAWYYMDTDGVMQTGWLLDGEARYYLDASGAMVTGWQTIENNRYFFLDWGGMATGWQEQGGNRYYLLENGAAATGWQEIDELRYYFDPDGAMHVGWLTTEDTRYYLNEEGGLHLGWMLDGTDWYWLTEQGAHVGWLERETARYYLGADGKMAVGWLYDEAWYYLDGSGAMATGWRMVGGSWYYLNEDGRMAVGWLWDGASWYWLDGGGAMRTGWLLLGETWYYLDASGAMHTGWLFDGTTWYWFDNGGAMVTGTVVIDGVTQRFAASGAWIS